MNSMHGIRCEVRENADEACAAAAQIMAESLRAASARFGDASLAVSGGQTPGTMLGALTTQMVPWEALHVFQVDERCAPDGHADRNATVLTAALSPVATVVDLGKHLHLIDVPDDATPGWNEAAAIAAQTYAALLPPRGLDVVHLGLGDDGHTASLVPGDPVLAIADLGVAVTGAYQHRHRITLTTPTIDRAHMIVWLVVGASKAPMVRRLLSGDETIPAGRFGGHTGVLVMDTAAALGL
jgi:6-phosphogluconolactonase